MAAKTDKVSRPATQNDNNKPTLVPRPIGATFKDGRFEYSIDSTPRIIPLAWIRADIDIPILDEPLFFGLFVRIVSVVVCAVATVLTWLLRLRWRVTISRRNLARRPPIWEVVSREYFRSFAEAESREIDIATNWDDGQYGEIPEKPRSWHDYIVPTAMLTLAVLLVVAVVVLNRLTGFGS